VGVIVAENGTVVLCNDAAGEILDMNREEVLGRQVEEALGVFREAVMGETPLTVERDGVAYEVTRSAVGVGGHTYLIQDVTMRQERLELQRKNERLDQFASVVSHDLRNPLNVILGHVRHMEVDEDNQPAVDAIKRSATRMENMIQDILALSRAGSTIEDLEQVPLTDVATESWETAQTDDANFELTLNESTTIRADRDRLRHIFENIFRNAVDHNEQPLTVRVGLLKATPGDSQQVGFFIEDDGDGIPADERDTVFDYGHTTSDEGTGFGLSIVRDVVDAHDWDIRIAESDEGGARFEFGGVEINT
jgi:signal transduction histidine kinase